MEILPVHTRRILPPQDDLYDVLDTSLPKLRERDIVCITSKVLAIHEGRCVKIGSIGKDALVRREAGRIVPSPRRARDFLLTIKNSTLIPSAGIDESNGNGYYILWPRRPSELCREFRLYLKKKYGLKHLAVIATDSHTTPLRFGVVGISVGFYGLEPLEDYRGERDIFSRTLEHTQVNIVDALASAATLAMGEGRERTPIVILRGVKRVRFTGKPTWKKLPIPPRQDLYYPLLKRFKKP